MVMSIGLIMKRTAKLNNNKYVAKTIKDQKSVLRRYEMCELSFNCSLRLTARNRWIASVKKEKEDQGVPFLDNIMDGPYTGYVSGDRMHFWRQIVRMYRRE